MHRLDTLFLAVLLSATSGLAQIRVVPGRVMPPMQIKIMEGNGVPPEILQAMGQPGVVQPSAQAASDSALLQAIRKLKFDRRPSATLKAWAKPEPAGVDGDEALVKLRKEIADLEALIAAEKTEGKPAGQDAPVKDGMEPFEPEAIETEVTETEVTETEVVEEVVIETPVIETPVIEEQISEELVPTEVPTEGVVLSTEPSAPTAVLPAPGASNASKLAAKKKAYEAAVLKLKVAAFARDVTLSRWDRVATFLAEMKEKDAGTAYRHLLKSLPNAPAKQGNQNLPRNLQENNVFSLSDILGIAAAAPAGIEPKEAKKNVGMLAPIVRRALDAGHAVEELLAMLRAEAAKPAESAVLVARDCALLLAGLGKTRELGSFLPSSEEAIAADDREALNLLSRFHLAWHAKEKKSIHLERAWTVTQAALAAGDVSDEEKAEALRRAVDLAPKIREELGDAWLVESFSARPERGMEIVATVGAQASRGFETHGRNPQFRRDGMRLQKTAVESLLSTAPERAEEWRVSLNLLANNWLAEARYSYKNSEATTRGPRIQRDSFGNIFYQDSGRGRGRGAVTAIEPGELLELRPEGRWVELLDESMRPRYSTVVAELYLKVNEEAEAFPYIEALAKTHPDKGRELAEEFLRVWTRNHNPNAASSRTDPYMFMYGFDQRKAAIPLTRSKQERNLKELAGWLSKLRGLPIEPVDQQLVVRAFTNSHSAAEVYRLETIESVFGSLDTVDPDTIAEMVQKMRTNLVGVWRQPAVQQAKKTKRRKKDIEREVLGGYETARAVVEGALKQHPKEWRLHAALAALGHDENNYQQEVKKSSAFAGNRKAALESLQRAAGLYAAGVGDLSVDEETVDPYELWFYAALGACDLQFVDEETVLASGEAAAIRGAIETLPGEARERHMTKFANLLFTRMSAVKPAVKLRYLKAGFEIVGDHPQAHEARKVFDYYNDLVTEIMLETEIDGPDEVGHGRPFGVRVNLRHTREIEREAGGFAKYLQNQNNMSYAYNYGRPLENYRDKFEDAATEALQEHFDVLSVTFNSESLHSIATENYGWRVTPYAYMLLKAKGPEVDKLPSVALDLDFLDTSGYAVVPVASAALPLDASSAAPTARPYKGLEITQILDERQAKEGKLSLEVKARAQGLVPEFDALFDFAPKEFEVDAVDDQGVAVSEFAEDQDGVISERIWMVTMVAKEGLAEHPSGFEFAVATDGEAKVTYQRYVDADLITTESSVSLDETYGDPAALWPWIVGAVVLLLAVLGFAFTRGGRRPAVAAVGRRVPDSLTPFTVLALLRDIESDGTLSGDHRQELNSTIQSIERGFFSGGEDESVDLAAVAQTWVQRAG